MGPLPALTESDSTITDHLPVTESMTNPLTRSEFREQCLDRDNHSCVVPWCDAAADEVHHIIERSEWAEGGYYLQNGASVCNPHHQLAEADYIPPHAFWRWLDVNPLTPDGSPNYITKWAELLDQPTEKKGPRNLIKYPSTGHLPNSPEHEHRQNDYDHQQLTNFICELEPDLPIVITKKMDGSNAMLTRPPDYMDEPSRHRPRHGVAARNGKHAEHESFDLLKKRNREEYGLKIPPHIQIVGEWLYARHSIHYSFAEQCDDPDCDDHGPPVSDYFQVFGVYDNRYELWLGWPEVERWADKIGAETVPVIDTKTFDYPDQLYELSQVADQTIQNGHEGLVIRSIYPFHYGQFEERVAKYVRKNHVKTNEHWRHTELVENQER